MQITSARSGSIVTVGRFVWPGSSHAQQFRSGPVSIASDTDNTEAEYVTPQATASILSGVATGAVWSAPKPVKSLGVEECGSSPQRVWELTGWRHLPLSLKDGYRGAYARD